MNTLIQAMNASNTTENGCKSYYSTMSKCLDFFYIAGASRGKSIEKEFIAAVAEDSTVAFATLMWLRDARQGAGERQQFKNLIKVAIQYMTEDQIKSVISSKICEIGRFDDLEVFFGTEYEEFAAKTWVNAISCGNALAAKWAPRKDKKGAKPLRKAAKMNEVQWRKFVVSRSDTVEQKMCSNEFNKIEYSHVPSVAMSRYMTAFHRNDESRFVAFRDALVKGETKINAGAVYPYELIKPFMNRYGVASTVKDVAIKQWESLPDFVQSDDNFLPVIDVSGSMSSIVSGTTSAMDVAVSLGLYLAERNKGTFKDVFMTFSERPELIQVVGDIEQKVRQIVSSNWGMSTDIEAVFNLILNAAIGNNVPECDMPKKILIVSDMQFNQCIDGLSAFDMIKSKYAAYGYELPQIVFWQVNARSGSIPVKAGEGGTALISGFSPSIMKSVLNGSLEPVQTMLDTVMIARYIV